MAAVMPFPATTVVHPGWAALNRPAAVGTLTGTCTITDPTGTADWQPGTGGTATDPAALYTGPCSVLDQARAAQRADAAGQSTTPGQYQVGIDPSIAPTTVPVGARVHMTAAPDNPDLTGRWLIVVSDSHGTTTLERVLTCDLDPGNQP